MINFLIHEINTKKRRKEKEKEKEKKKKKKRNKKRFTSLFSLLSYLWTLNQKAHNISIYQYYEQTSEKSGSSMLIQLEQGIFIGIIFCCDDLI